MTDWCILRTAGRSTLPLAESLAGDGFEVWTPSLVLDQRLPRTRARIERRAPIMPTYLFARARHLGDLMLLSGDPTKRHDGFSIYHYLGRIPLVADEELEALRTAENRGTPRRKQKTYGPGESVRVPEGAFGGMSGIVEHGDRRHTLVLFNGTTRVKISTFLLRPHHIGSEQPNLGDAAKAA